RLVQGSRKVIHGPVPMHVLSSNLDLFQAIENVELGYDQSVDVAELDRISNGDQVKPPAAARAARCGSVLAAHLSKHLPGGVLQLRREGAPPHARRVSLGHAPHLTYPARRKPRAGPQAEK